MENLKETEKLEEENTEKAESTSNTEKAENIESTIVEDPINIKKEKKLTPTKWLIIGVVVFAVLLLLSTVFALFNINNEKIIGKVTIDHLAIKGLDKTQVKQLLENKIQEKINKEIKININNEEQTLLLSQLELEYNTEDAIEEAYNIGRNSNIFVNNFNIVKSYLLGKNISLPYSYNEDLLVKAIEEIKAKIPNGVIPYSYCIEEDKLIITKGQKGQSIDEKELLQKIKNNIELSTFEAIELQTFEIEPEEIDIDKIYQEVYSEAKDAYYTTNPFQVYPEVIGIDFNIEEAKEIIQEEKDEYVILLTITKPKKTINDIGTEAFPDLLSTFTTRYDESNVSRSTNLKIAARKINGTVVLPGDIFSYNKTVGKRTVEEGYRDAAGYEGGKVVQMLGGGICQVSSTLYDSVVYANLDVVERHNHAFLTSYIGAGKDATVVYGSLDFKFKNTRKNPISIKTSASNGILKIDIYGIKEDTEYEVEISTTVLSYIPPTVVYENDANLAEGIEKVTQNGMNGCKSVTYKILKQNGVEVSRTVLSSDTYDAMNKYVIRGTRAIQSYEEPVPEPSVTPQEPEVPTTPSEPEIPIPPTIPEEPTTPEEPPANPGEGTTPDGDNLEP